MIPSQSLGSEKDCELRTAAEGPRCPTCYVITGVSGCGKSTVGRMLADELGSPFYDGDDFHPDSNREKMRRGHPLTDNDRLPWLHRLAKLLEEHAKEKKLCVLACSCLKLRYRQILSGESGAAACTGDIAFVLLQPSREELERRVKEREKTGTHFMPASLLDSQLKELEIEPSSMTFHAMKPEEIVAAIVEARSRGI